jgi:glycerophosphoryl diester phosphodiesterase
MRFAFVAFLAACASACSSSPAAKSKHSPPEASAGSGGSVDASAEGTGGDAGDARDASVDGDAGASIDSLGGSSGADASYARTYRNSLSVCWTDARCPRVFAVAHGGQWDLNDAPYDSNGAIKAAFAGGVDGVKLDVRVTKDNVPVIAHSSPILGYESLDCSGDKIEDMTAAQVTQCHRFPTTNENFQRLDDVLNYLRGKMVVQLTVKLSTDYARTIQQVLDQNAQDFAFLEISTSDLQNIIPTIPGSDKVYYLIDIETDLTQVDTLLDTIQNPRAFMYEFAPSVDVSTLTPSRLHPAGIRSFVYTNALGPSVADLQALYEDGYDVVSSQGSSNGVKARIAVNQSHGVSPP